MEYDEDVAPLMFDQELLFELFCHWYVIVPYGAVATAVSVLLPPMKTSPPTGCVVKVGASTETVTLTEFESAYVVYPLSVFVTRTL